MPGLQRLRVRRGALLALMVLTGARATLADSPADARLAAITPVFGQLVMFSLPAEFKSQKPTYEKNSGSFYIREQVPDGETQAMLARMSADFQRNCPDSFSTEAPGPQKVDGYDAYEVIVSCGRMGSGKESYSNSAVMLAVKGSNDYYTLQWTERGRDSAAAIPIDTAYWTKQLGRLNPIRLCPIVPGEAAPYASCARR